MAPRIKGEKPTTTTKAKPAAKKSPEPQTITSEPETTPETPAPEAANENEPEEGQSSLGWTEDEADAIERAMLEAGREDRQERVKQEAESQPQHDGALPVDADGYIRREAWPEIMGGFFHVAGAFTGLQSLAIDKADGTYIQAAYAVWDTCRETPYMDFLIRPGGKWMQRIAVIGAFAVPLYMNCKAEIAMKRAAVEMSNSGQAAPEAANDDAPMADNDNQPTEAAPGMPGADGW